MDNFTDLVCSRKPKGKGIVRVGRMSGSTIDMSPYTKQLLEDNRRLIERIRVLKARRKVCLLGFCIYIEDNRY